MVVVGIRRDAAIKELLTWALVKVANTGDRVIALHVTTLHVVASVVDGLLMGVDERRRAVDSLASVLAVYDGFCNLKQLNLDIPRGHPKSTRRQASASHKENSHKTDQGSEKQRFI